MQCLKNKGKQTLKPIARMGSICRWLSLKKKITEQCKPSTGRYANCCAEKLPGNPSYLHEELELFILSISISEKETHPALIPSKHHAPSMMSHATSRL